MAPGGTGTLGSRLEIASHPVSNRVPVSMTASLFISFLLFGAQVHGMEVRIKMIVCGETPLALIEVFH